VSSLEKLMKGFEGDRNALISKGIGLLMYSLVVGTGNKLFSVRWGDYVIDIYEPSPLRVRRQAPPRRTQQTTRRRGGASITTFIKGLEGVEEAPSGKSPGKPAEEPTNRVEPIREEPKKAEEHGVDVVIERIIDMVTREVGVEREKARELSSRMLDYLSSHPSVGIIRLVEDVLRGYDGDKEAARMLITRVLTMLDDAGIVDVVDGSVVNLVVKLPRRRSYTLSFTG